MKKSLVLFLVLVFAISLVSAGCKTYSNQDITYYDDRDYHKYKDYDDRKYDKYYDKWKYYKYDKRDYDWKYDKYKDYDWDDRYYKKYKRYDDNLDRVVDALWYGDPEARRVLRKSLEDKEDFRCYKYKRCWYY